MGVGRCTVFSRISSLYFADCDHVDGVGGGGWRESIAGVVLTMGG